MTERQKIYGAMERDVQLIRLHSKLSFFSCEIECYADSILDNDREFLRDVASELDWAVRHLNKAMALLSDKYDKTVGEKDC